MSSHIGVQCALGARFLLFSFSVAALGLTAIPTTAQVESPLHDPSDPDQQLVFELIREFEGRTSHALRSPVVVYEPSMGADTGLMNRYLDAQSRGFFAASSPALLRDDGLVYQDAGPPDHCVIILTPEGEGMEGADRRNILAHEVFHCFIYDAFESRPALALEDWVHEGIVEWAAQAVAPSEPIGAYRWEPYLNTAVPLTARDYDAFPLFANLAHHGLDMWRHWKTIPDPDSRIAFDNLQDRAGRRLSTWAPSVMRQPTWGDAWDAHGPVIPDDSYYPYELITYLGEGSLAFDLPPLTPRLYRLLIVDDFPVRLSIAKSTGAVRQGQAATTSHEEFFDSDYRRTLCAGECFCEDGDPGGVVNLPRGSTVVIAVAGLWEGGSMTIEPGDTNCCDPRRTIRPELVGTWEVDLQHLVATALPEVAPTASIAGRYWIVIEPNGHITRVLDGIRIRNTAHNFEWYFQNIDGVVSGCLSTEFAPSPDRAYFVISRVREEVDAVVGVAQGRSVAKSEEPLLTRWGLGSEDSIGYLTIADERTVQIKGSLVMHRVSER